MKPTKPLAAFLAFVFSATCLQAATPSSPPPATQNLVLSAPIRSWDEAVPLGSGLTGGLLWGEGNLPHYQVVVLPDATTGEARSARFTAQPRYVFLTNTLNF